MALASGARVDVAYIAEVTRGTTPGSPTTKVLRAITRNINLTKNILGSKEVRSDRQVADSRHGFCQVAGTFGYELSVAGQDDMLEAALSGTFTAVTTCSGVNLSSTVTTNVYTRASGDFVAAGFLPGDLIVVAGFSNSENNGQHQVIAVAQTTLTVAEVLSTETTNSGRTITFTGKRLKGGTTLKTFTFERRFNDIAQFQVFRGIAINQMRLNIQPEAIVGGDFTVLGMSAAALSGTSICASPTAAGTHDPLSSFDGTLYENKVLLATVTGLDMTITNGRGVQAVVGSTTSPDVFEGTMQVGGSLTAFFENATLFNKFVNETESSLYIRLDDLNNTDFVNIVIPRVKYNGGEMDPPAEGPVVMTLPFQGLVDVASATSLWIQRSNT